MRGGLIPRLRLGLNEGDVDGASEYVDRGAEEEDGAPRAERVTALKRTNSHQMVSFFIKFKGK